MINHLEMDGIFKNPKIKDMLSHTADFVESEQYFSWEQFFANYLGEISKDGYLKYSKKKLNRNYLQDGIKKQILQSINEVVFDRQGQREP